MSKECSERKKAAFAALRAVEAEFATWRSSKSARFFDRESRRLQAAWDKAFREYVASYAAWGAERQARRQLASR
jgi:hypothetical protein